MKLKKCLAVLLVLVLSVCMLASCGGNENAAPEASASPEAQGEATVSIYIEDEGRHVAKEQAAVIEEGNSIFDVTLKVIKENKIHIDYEGAGGSAYIKGIDNIYSGDKGENSAWLLYVNGKKAEVGAGDIEAKDGDVIEWKYVLDWETAE